MINDEKACELMRKEIDKVEIEEPVFNKNYWWVIGGGALLTIIAVIIQIAMGFSKTFVPIIVAFVIASLTIFIVSTLHGAYKKKVAMKNSSALGPIVEKLYQIYFDNTQGLVDSSINFKYEGINRGKVYRGINGLSFKLNNEEVRFALNQDKEQRTRTVTNSDGKRVSETYWVYILKYQLDSTAKKLDGYDPIEFVARKTRNKDGFFVSESIEFNKNYRATGWNQMQMYKLFQPKVIDGFASGKYFLGTNRVFFNDGNASVLWRDMREQEVPYHYDVLDFSGVAWSGHNVAQKVIDKIRKVAAFYFESQNMLIPFDLYDDFD
ncbi:hypothetical protein [Mesoplasma lactucae]|uniref:Uncharacterized protein n=1 Tax=Mesoplasma lactucae ATCC 49193 TaxID=81460 RepID=A0A291ISG7_9MOLU|nr:hypothetical protein [Mesoplasma lactucae]ATG97700.1 hypothetical protein CP520_03100 [Mesoplasma lactucae ATCC 49193]ATZ19834.1 hypothetical protein MLACT_v1c00090 [Mesoplasma lactucae ATCC 49193]MCL8216697.1 hypothetical protein [Mesoplasma lactucae ATCC 49193]